MRKKAMTAISVRIPNKACAEQEGAALVLPADGNATKNVVNSLAKGFRVLETFTALAPELLLSEVARAAGVDNATAFRLLNTLVMLGYVAKVPGSRRFRLTLKALDLGYNAIARMDLREIARPVLRSLVGEVNEAASIGVLDGPDVIYIERVQAGLIRLGVDVRVGTRIPAYYAAIGHAILAFLPKEDARRVLDSRERVKVNAHALTTLPELEARLGAVREAGYALSDSDIVSGLRVLAVPILDRDGFAIASLSAAAPSIRMPLNAFKATALAPLRAAAAELGKALTAAGHTTSISRTA